MLLHPFYLWLVVGLATLLRENALFVLVPEAESELVLNFFQESARAVWLFRFRVFFWNLGRVTGIRIGTRLNFFNEVTQNVFDASLFLSYFVTVQQFLQKLLVQSSLKRKVGHGLKSILNSLWRSSRLERFRVWDQRQIGRSRSLRNLSRPCLAVSYYLC